MGYSPRVEESSLCLSCSALLVQITLDISVFYTVSHLDLMTTATCSCEVLLTFFAVLAGSVHIHTLEVSHCPFRTY